VDGNEKVLELRRELHRAAELSGEEERTSALIRGYLESLEPDSLHEGLGGHGVAAVFEGGSDGPRALVRCELDALPIPERPGEEDASETPGVSHRCGHDGHMAIVAALALDLSIRRPSRGSVVVLFQPAEETGAGARLVIDDEKFAGIRPDLALALHNVPGYRLGTVVLRDGSFASTARSLRVNLTGRTAHAAEPEKGLSPTPALAGILSEWPAVPRTTGSSEEGALVTVVHARLGEPALGTSPGIATAIATLRAQSGKAMGRLSDRCLEVAEGLADAHGLSIESEWLEEFPCTESDASVNEIVERVTRSLGLPVVRLARPFAWTEDFGHFTERFGGAMFGLGSGDENAPLHHPDYRFPENLVIVGARLFRDITDVLLATEGFWTQERA
jgi:amidohydrolase